MSLTVERLKEVLFYDPYTGNFTWKKPTSNRVKLGSIAGVEDSQGYIAIRLDTVLYKAHRLAWLYCFEEWPVEFIDHINNIKSDNRLDNLREATAQENCRNKVRQSNNTTGYIGVSYYAVNNKYRATIQVDNKTKHIGYYNTAEEASTAYKSKALELFGEFIYNESNTNLL